MGAPFPWIPSQPTGASGTCPLAPPPVPWSTGQSRQNGARGGQSVVAGQWVPVVANPWELDTGQSLCQASGHSLGPRTAHVLSETDLPGTAAGPFVFDASGPIRGPVGVQAPS